MEDNTGEPELPGMLEVAIRTEKQEWPHTADAAVWAVEWLKIIAEHPTTPLDEGAMIGWFANAIMAGYDTARMQVGKARSETKIKVEELLKAYEARIRNTLLAKTPDSLKADNEAASKIKDMILDLISKA